MITHQSQAIVPMIDLNPLNWLGDAAREGVADAFTAMMMALWSAALWLLQAVFTLLDKFTTPNVADPGLNHLYGVTLWISLFVALLIAFGQIGLAAIRRDGRSLGTVAIGLAQYGAVVTAWIAVCAALVMACAGLTTGLLRELLAVNSFAGYAAGDGWVDQVSGTVEATVLGVCALFMLIPAAFGYLLIMLVREAALLILTATMPIAAAGALGEGTKAWMWKSIRWFAAACLTSPLLALVLGLGVQISRAAFPEDPATTAAVQMGVDQIPVSDSASNVGMAVVGCVIMLIACFCPMVLFRLLAFVDPGTGSGASFRSTMAANGGLAGLMSGQRGAEDGSGAATQVASDGRTASETSADTETANRFQFKVARSLGAVGAVAGGAMTKIGDVAQQGAAMGVDVMGQSGVGQQGYYDTTPRVRPPSRPGKQSQSARVGHGWDPGQGAMQPPGHRAESQTQTQPQVPPEAEAVAQDGAVLS